MSAYRLISPKKRRAAAEVLSRQLPPLLLDAQRVAATVAMGIHGRRRQGTGEQFWQYRPSLAGDSASLIDWRASARSPQLLVREREWETAQTALIWVDKSGSMNWRSSPNFSVKQARAELIGLALADLLLRAGERVAFLGSQMPTPVSGRNALARLALSFDKSHDDGKAWPTTLAFNPSKTKQARLIVISDFLDQPDHIQQQIDTFARLGLFGCAFQVLDPTEKAPTWSGRIRLSGLEGERTLTLQRAEHTLQNYHAAFEAHQEKIAALFARQGWPFITHTTDQKPEMALLSLHEALSQGRGRQA